MKSGWHLDWGGGERPLGIPTIRDRVVQTAVVLFLEPIFEADFEDNVYGYRPSRSAHDAQGGVISPLLANIYINRLLRHWRETGASERLGRIVSYADDFVILCRSQGQARESLDLVSRWVERLGLAIHPEKTRLCFVWDEPFDFLGYTFRSIERIHTGRRILTAVPAKKARRRIQEKVNALLYRGNPTPWPELREKLNRLLAGWANYFSFGWTGGADGAIWWHTYQRVRRFLCKRHKLPAQGSRFRVAEVFGSVGVLDLPRYRQQRRAAHALS